MPDARLIVAGGGPQREAMEALVWALSQGWGDLALQIADACAKVEDGGGGRDPAVAAFFEALRAAGGLEAYFDASRQLVDADRVLFTG